MKGRFALGTVQLGKKYFSNNHITQERANRILSLAFRERINLIDTARKYGRSEEYIGQFLLKNKKRFFISSKLAPIKNSTNEKKIIDQVKKSIFKSLDLLNVNYLDYLFIHDQKNINNETILEELSRLKKFGLIKNIGISIYDQKNLLYLKKKIFNSVQLPFNLFDHRFLNFIAKNKKYKIFARSLLLRGNIVRHKISLPKRNKYNSLKKEINFFCSKNNYKNYFDLNFSFLNFFKKKINYFLLGFQNTNEMKILNEFKNATAMSKKNVKQVIKIVKKSNISKDIDLRFW